jgi:hypothetical protein
LSLPATGVSRFIERPIFHTAPGRAVWQKVVLPVAGVAPRGNNTLHASKYSRERSERISMLARARARRHHKRDPKSLPLKISLLCVRVSLALAENMLVLTSFIKSARAAIAVINKKL